MHSTGGIINTEYNSRNIWHNLLIVFAIFLCVLMCMPVLKNETETENIEYPLESVYNSIPYVQQFDAFKKGQIELDVEPDPQLVGLKNPYDPYQRDGVPYLWDRAYYDGNYYSYFGIAPIFTVYFPYYLIFGALPSTLIVCFILAVFSVIFTSLAYREAILRFAPSANLWLVVAGLFAVVMGGGLLLGLSWPDNYYIAVLSAIQNSMAFLFFAMRGMRGERVWSRSLLLAISAVFLVLTVWSRPTVAVMCLVALPLLIEFFIKGFKSAPRSAIISAASFGVVLIIGAILVMWYNAVRFSSPFDFGNNYQLTVSDISKNKLTFSLFTEAMVSFFVQSPGLSDKFPFVNTSYLTFDTGDRYVYVASTVGAFNFGLPWAGLTAPFVLGYKRDKTAFFTFLSLLALSVGVAFSDYCLGGVNLRYLLDFLPLLVMLSAVFLLALHTRAESGMQKRFVTVLSLILFTIAIFMVYGIVKGNPDDLLWNVKK